MDFHEKPSGGGGGDDLLSMSSGGQMLEKVHDDWEIDASDLVFEKEIASGTFGSVWKGQFQRYACIDFDFDFFFSFFFR